MRGRGAEPDARAHQALGFRMLHALGDEVVAEIPAGVVTRRSADGRFAGLFFHYPPEEPQTVPASFGTRDVADATLALGSPLAIELTLTGLPPGARPPGRGEASERRAAIASPRWSSRTSSVSRAPGRRPVRVSSMASGLPSASVASATSRVPNDAGTVCGSSGG